MANKTIRILTIILAAQVLLSIAMFYSGSNMTAQPPNTPLLNFSKEVVDGITIMNAEGQATELSKKAGQWSLLAPNFPVENDKVNNLLGRMQDLQHGLPVATSRAALSRFKVAEQGFERRIRLKQGDKIIADLFLGESAGARQNYARSVSDEVVYSVALGSYDVPSSAEDWMNKAILKLEASVIQNISIADWQLQRQAKSDPAIWESKTLPEGKLINQKAINDWLAAITPVRFTQLLGTEVKPEYGLGQPLLNVTLQYDKGKRDYLIGQLKGSEDYVLKVSDRAEYFQIPAYTGKSLLEAGQEKWLLDQPPSTEETQPAEEKPATPETETPQSTE